MKIPFFRPDVSTDEIRAVTDVLKSGWLTTGPRVAKFEKKFTAYKKSSYALAVHSCSAAIHLSLKAMDFQPGDEVITTPLSFPSTATMIHQAGLKPVFADVHPETLNIHPGEILKKISHRTRVVIPVHLGGNPCDMKKILSIAKNYKLKVIEDCAHACESMFGKKHVGTFSDAGCFSFYPSKNLTSADGGMVTTNDKKLAEKIRLLRYHGMNQNTWQRNRKKNMAQMDIFLPGFKYNMNDLQAALALVNLKHVEEKWNRRKKIAERYDEAFRNEELFSPVKNFSTNKNAHHLYIIQLQLEKLKKSRDEIIAILSEKGVQCSVHFYPIHLYTFYREHYDYKSGDYPMAEKASRRIISLPIFPTMHDSEIEFVIGTITKTIRQSSR